MAESKRLESMSEADPADRDRRVEGLLVEGLDLYFSGQYDDAIHLWTRVLFLDRTDARARAYIDRARSALAERQRRAEELLHASQRLLEKGDTARARDLLTEAVATSGDDERAADVRVRLERVERLRAADRLASPAESSGTAPLVHRMRRPSSASPWRLAAAVTAILMMVILASAPAIQDWIGAGPVGQDLASAAPAVPLSVLSSSQVAFVRARTLFARGRLAEALRALERVDPRSSTRDQADQLRVDIQQLLLASGEEHAPALRRPEAGRP
jgi:tetratricopeptide (TPR) repeat protein